MAALRDPLTRGALVVNADDLGVSRGATLGILRAHRDGIVTSASLAVTTPAYGHALETCVAACPGLGIGLHLTLTSGRPVSPPREVPLLVDGAGFFRWRFTSLLGALAGPAGNALRKQISRELEAQVEKARSDGVRLDHLDGERHVHLIPAIFPIAADLALRHGIPYLRAGRDCGPGLLRVAEVVPLLAAGGFAKLALLGPFAARARRRLPAGLRSAENLASFLYSGRLDRLLPRLLGRPAESGITEVMVHPGVPEESRDLALGNPELERYLGDEGRRRELEACLGPLDSLGAWHLTTFGRLAAGERQE